MNRKFVSVLADVYCDWTGNPPCYRVYVNSELFAERTWIWKDDYLEENIPVEAEPGTYCITYELVQPHSATIKIRNLRVSNPEATITENGMLTIA